jgi:hypothetical protein
MNNKWIDLLILDSFPFVTIRYITIPNNDIWFNEGENPKFPCGPVLSLMIQFPPRTVKTLVNFYFKLSSLFNFLCFFLKKTFIGYYCQMWWHKLLKFIFGKSSKTCEDPVMKITQGNYDFCHLFIEWILHKTISQIKKIYWDFIIGSVYDFFY